MINAPSDREAALIAKKRKRERERYWANIEESRRKKREAWYRRPKEKRKEYAAARYRNRTPSDIAKKKICDKRRRLKKSILAMTDPDFYSQLRALQRIYNVRHRNKTRKRQYRPLWSMRFPDYATKDSRIMDTASPWLIENLTDSQRGYARELAIERKERAMA